MSENMGRFIVIEGIDGAGKSTQARLLREHLEKQGRRVVSCAEPTEWESGRALRRVLSGNEKKSESETALMFVLDRIVHNLEPNEGILALIKQGYDVICDRYYYSTLAYQGSVVDYGWVRSMNLDCPDIRHPDLCLFFDLSPEESLRRISSSRADTEIYENLETLTRVRESFHRVIRDLEGVDTIRIIDASRSVEEIACEVSQTVDSLLK